MFTAETLFWYCLELLNESEQASQKIVRGRDVEQARERHAEDGEADRSVRDAFRTFQSVGGKSRSRLTSGRQCEA